MTGRLFTCHHHLGSTAELHSFLRSTAYLESHEILVSFLSAVVTAWNPYSPFITAVVSMRKV